MTETRQDPLWVRFAGCEIESEVVDHSPRLSAPTLGVGGFICDGCGKPHVLVATIFANLETDIRLTPADARAAAAELIAVANRVDPQGTH